MRVARENAPVELAPHAVERMLEARALVERSLERGDEVYGMTTGVGARKKVRVAPDEIASFNRALIANHRVGVGPGRARGDRPGDHAPARERARQGDDRACAPRSRSASSLH